jgi:hypothetical protein
MTTDTVLRATSGMLHIARYELRDSKSLAELREYADELESHKWDSRCEPAEFYFNEQGNLVIRQGGLFRTGTELGFTPWSFRQVCQRTHVPIDYAQRIPPTLRALNWANGIPDEKVWLFRSYDDQCRGALSDRYSVVRNSVLIPAIIDVVEDRYPLCRPYIDRDTLHVRIEMVNRDFDGPRPSRGNYSAGVYIGNGEVGQEKLRIHPFVKRTSCDNSTIFTDSGMTMVHHGLTEAFARAAVYQTMGQVLGLAVERIELLINAVTRPLPGEFAAYVDNMCKEKGFSEAVRDDILIGSEGQENLFGLVTGMTWAAQRQDAIETTIELEMFAGALLTGKAQLAHEDG